MKKILAVGFATILMALVADRAMAADSQVWTTLNVSGTIAENMTLSVQEELRFGDITDLSLARQHTDLSLGFRVNDLVGVGVGYRNTSAGEHRPYVGLGLALLRGDVNLDSATAIELSEFETLSGRTALTASVDVSGLTLGVSDEVRLNEDGLIHNRASLGVTRAVNNTFSVSAYYMLNSTGTDLSNNAHVVGLGLGVSL
tara:strand:+ start:85 stop:684 length:600 start_codon:yes stop_codon:yes gene_type:complete